MRGTPAQPRLNGTLSLSNGLFHDFGEGIQLSGMQGTVNAVGDRLVIAALTAQAGKGSLAVSGSYGVLQPGQPIDLHVHADNARPLASDLITATLNGDLDVKGQLSSRIDATGNLTLKRVDINIPDSCPVRSLIWMSYAPRTKRIRTRPQSRAAGGRAGAGCDLAGAVLCARAWPEYGNAWPCPRRRHRNRTGDDGAFSLVKGGFSLGGISLDFSKGQVGFNGMG